MIRAYDDNGNVVDLVDWEKKIRADTIDEMSDKLQDLLYHDFNITLDRLLQTEKELKDDCNK